MISYSKDNYFSIKDKNDCIDFCFGNNKKELSQKSFPFVKNNFISLGQPHGREVFHLEENFFFILQSKSKIIG